MVTTTKSAVLETGTAGFNGNATIEGMRFSGVLGIPIRTTGDVSFAGTGFKQALFDPASMVSGGIGVTAMVSAAGDNFAPAIGDVWTVRYVAPLGSVAGQASGPFVVNALVTETWTRIA